MKLFLLLCFWVSACCIVNAQAPKVNLPYDPHDFFASEFNPPAGNMYRSANGTPGPMYWQNSASYRIHATLSEKDTSISGDVSITYTNNSPDKLDYVWLQLDQNLFDSLSRGAAVDPNGTAGYRWGGFHIASVTVKQGDKSYSVSPIISDTRMQIRLKSPVFAKGGKIVIKMNFNFRIPLDGDDRMGRVYVKDGVVYSIAQWYPRVCVYDDVEGWNTLPYLNLGEFYCEYGDYDYYITAPSDMIVYGSGDLQNATEVLTAEEIRRLSQAAKSDQTVRIIDKDEVHSSKMRPPGKSGVLTWHFTMKNTRDVAWAASNALVWDAAKVNVPSGRKVMAMSAYPRESIGDTAWTRATEYLKKSMEIYSRDFFEYPWNSAVNIGCAVSGMEYPGMIFNDYKETKAPLWFVISHEIGHNWFPMIVGSNERKYMWQDEGLNSYINFYANTIFNNGEYAKSPALYSKDNFAYLVLDSLPLFKDPLMTISDAMDLPQHHSYYSKTAYGLQLLRDVVVGKDRFNYAFRKYTETWAYKHPTPYDFFHCINNATGEDLNWFWKEWFFTTWMLDQSITGVQYTGGDPSKGISITIQNTGRMILPVIVKIVQHNGETALVKLPVEVWQHGGSWTFHYNSTQTVDQVILDPDHVLPDINRSNNVWSK